MEEKQRAHKEQGHKGEGNDHDDTHSTEIRSIAGDKRLGVIEVQLLSEWVIEWIRGQ